MNQYDDLHSLTLVIWPHVQMCKRHCFFWQPVYSDLPCMFCIVCMLFLVCIENRKLNIEHYNYKVPSLQIHASMHPRLNTTTIGIETHCTPVNVRLSC